MFGESTFYYRLQQDTYRGAGQQQLEADVRDLEVARSILATQSIKTD